MKTIICEKNAMYAAAADRIRDRLAAKPASVLALACGRTMVPLWDRLAALHAQGEPDFSEARVLAVTEFVGVPPSLSCRRALEAGLLSRVGAAPERCSFPDPEAPGRYDALIESLGGIDLAVLGIGEDCHIGYNEPGTLFDTHTHLQKLTERTRRQLLRRGFDETTLPDTAVTMGVKTLTDAREILLLACGEDKAAAVYEMLYAKTTSYIPAAYLQLPTEVTVLLDRAAAGRL